MKKCLMITVALSMMVSLTNCKAKNSGEEAKGSKENFDINIATNILNSYMGYLFTGDVTKAEQLYSEKLAKKGIQPYPTDLKMLGFKTDEVNEVGRSGVFKVKVARSVPNRVITVLDNYNIKVELEKNEYKITEINTNTEKEAFLENQGIRLKDKNNVKSNLVVDLAGIPYYAFPKDDAAKINKAPVPRSNFGITVFNYSGERIAITTQDTENSFIGIIKIDETQATQGGGGGGGNSGGGGGGGDGGGGSSLIIKEPPIGKDITALDIIRNGTIESIAFSLEEKHLMSQYGIKDKGTSLRVYDVDSGELVDYKFEEKFPMEKVDVVFSSFDKDALNFEVKEKTGTGKTEAELLGKWQLDLKKYEAKKL